MIGLYFNDGSQSKIGCYLAADVTATTTQCLPDGSREVTVDVALSLDVPPDVATFPSYGADARARVVRCAVRAGGDWRATRERIAMRLLITGGAGFIGSNLVRGALGEGLDVAVLDDLSTGHRANLAGLDVRFVEGSLLDVGAVADALTDVDAVVHLAALGSVPRSLANPLASHAANATGTLTLLEQVRLAGVTHVVGASSSSVYGANPALPKGEREWVRPMSPYAVSKLAAEQYLLAYQSSFGLETLAFRFFNVFGPRQMAGHAYAAVIPTFVDSLLSNRPLPVNGDGTHSRDFTYVGTVCRVLIDAVVRRVSHPEPVNLAFGTNTTLLELIDALAETTGRVPVVEHRPERPGDVRHSRADNAVLRSLFPDVVPVPLRGGLAETVAWFEGER